MEPTQESRERHARRLGDVVEAQREVAAAGLDPDAVMAAIARRAQAVTESAGAVVELAEGDHMVYRAASGMAAPYLGLRLRRDASASGLCVRLGERLHVADTETDERVDRPACRRLGVRSMILVPLRHGERTVGVLKVMSPRERAFGPGDEDALDLMAGVLGAALANAAAHVALRESEQRFRLIFEQGPLGIVVVGADLRFTEVNDAMCRIVGYARAELVGKTFAEITHPADVDKDVTLARLLFDNEIPSYGIDKRYITKEGRVRWVHLTGTVVRDAAGAPAYALGVIEDITERKHVEQELDETREALARRERAAALGTLVMGVAHEVNNPLTFLRAGAQLTRDAVDRVLADPALAPEHRRALEDAVRHQRYALNAVDRLARIGVGLREVASAGAPGESRLVDVHALLEHVLAVLAPRVPKGVEVVRDVHPVRPVVIRSGDLAQALLAVVVNALEAMGEGEGHRLVVATREEGARVVVETTDTGVGIADEHRGRVFTPFFTTKPKGTGLALATAYRVVEDNGGRLTFTSETGKGTTFRMELPVG